MSPIILLENDRSFMVKESHMLMSGRRQPAGFGEPSRPERSTARISHMLQSKNQFVYRQGRHDSFSPANSFIKDTFALGANAYVQFAMWGENPALKFSCDTAQARVRTLSPESAAEYFAVGFNPPVACGHQV